MPEFFEVWWQPTLGALHVLGIAWFGASLLTEAPRIRRIGLAWMLVTGAALFLANAERVWTSTAFKLKLGLLVALLLVRGPRWLALGLWAAVIFASRGIAYF